MEIFAIYINFYIQFLELLFTFFIFLSNNIIPILFYIKCLTPYIKKKEKRKKKKFYFFNSFFFL